MKIIIPKEYETVDLIKEQDPNKFGEAMRGYCFIGNCMETGCYSTFEVFESLKQVKSGKIFEEVKKQIGWEDIQPTVYHLKLNEKDVTLYCKDSDGNLASAIMGDTYEIVCGWAWDGDGILYMRYNNRAVINTDCKKDYYWEWVNESK